MVKKYLKEAAARARTTRLNAPGSVPSCQETVAVDKFRHGSSITITDDDAESQAESDCGYDGGVNMNLSDSDEDGTDWTDSDEESLSEFSGEELERNLQELRKEAEALWEPEVNWKLMERKSSKDWEKAEKNRALGYTGLSDRTRQRHEKQARDRAALRKAAQTS
jgi:hypothetical protein